MTGCPPGLDHPGKLEDGGGDRRRGLKTHEAAGTETGLAADCIIWHGKGQRGLRPRTGSSGKGGPPE